MWIFLIVLIVVVSVIVLLSLFYPQALPWPRPHLNLIKSEIEPIKDYPQTRQAPLKGASVKSKSENDFQISLEENVARLETILHEKNRTIEKLQRELASEKSHKREYDKIKAILDDEIINLKTQNKELKTQIGGSHA